MKNKKARVIAIYLPQYHPVPENDRVWGKGFTEWTNVAQARPLFKGHYQPRVPADFGFYDLRLPEVREMQADYAREAGIEGFAYYQYYFGGGRILLEKPFETVLKSGTPNFPFCLYWANHSWQTKSWDRLERGESMIMEQRYDGEKQCIEHFMYNLPAFKDTRYIRVDDKPLFFIWNPRENPEYIKTLIECWQKLATDNGLKGIHFVTRLSKEATRDQLLGLGFDAVYQAREEIAINGSEEWTFWHKLRNRLIKSYGIIVGFNKADFGKNYKLLTTEDVKEKDVYPQLCSGYDRSPRAGKKAQIFYNFTPETWRKHIKHVFSFISHKDQEHNLVILKSWNEWGESNYVEPDQKYGNAMLDVLHEELTK